ncbi:MAG: carbohydrate binding domain-containing protein, partial [Planctomycetia bacterium]|nr:carbohydrate binding domain-containing protein [Planctomycetia bacterium]
MTTHLTRRLLCLTILASAATASGQTLELQPIELRPNLLPDGSFETASGEPTPPWQWHQGKTDAVGRIDASESHTGKQSLRVSNSTPFAAHVFGMLALSGDVAVKPNAVYTFSCYVKGPRIGIAWFGGGKDWRIRARLPERTGGGWTRVVMPFTTGADETRIPVILATENPTDPFWVDDLQLVEGGEPMPVFDQSQPGAAALEISLPPGPTARRGDREIVCAWNPIDYPRDRYLFAPGDITAQGYLYLPGDLAEGTLAFRLIGADGKTLAEKSQRGAMKAGMYRLTLSTPTGKVGPGESDVRLLVGLDGKAADDKAVHVEADLRRRLVTPAEVEAAIARVEPLRAKLAEHVALLERDGRDPAYLRVTLTILENFVDYARQDVAQGELARALDAATQMEAMAKAAIERTYLPAVPRYVTGPGCPGYRLDGPSQLGTV